MVPPVAGIGIGVIAAPPVVCALTALSVNVNSSSVFGVLPLTIFFTGIYFVTERYWLVMVTWASVASLIWPWAV